MWGGKRPRIGWSLSASPPMREQNSRGKFTTTSYSLSQPTKAHGSNQLLLLFCKCDALLPAKFHGIQDLLEAGMMADIGQQRIDAQPSGAVVAFAHGTVQPLDGPVGFAEDGIRFCCIERRKGCRSACLSTSSSISLSAR